MKNWFTSANGAITLSALALVLFLGRSFLDFEFVVGQFSPPTSQVAMGVLLYMAFCAGGLGVYWPARAAVAAA